MFGKERLEHKGPSGEYVGYTQENERFFGGKYYEHYNADGEYIGETDPDSGIFRKDLDNSTTSSTPHVFSAGVRGLAAASAGSGVALGSAATGIGTLVLSMGPFGLVIGIFLAIVAFTWVVGLIAFFVIPALISLLTPCRLVVALAPLFMSIAMPVSMLFANEHNSWWQLVMALLLWPMGFFHWIVGNFDEASTDSMLSIFAGVIVVSVALNILANLFETQS